MTDPVSSFLQGFAIVDRLETNRQVRSERKEQQSRLRTIWDRQDKQYERLQLEQMQHDNLVQFQAVTSGLMDEIAGQMEQVRKAHADAGRPEDGERAAEALSTAWFGNSNAVNGKANGFVRIANESVKRMIAANPQFGEHIALSLGFDAAAGPLVRDKTRPVSGAGFVPAEFSPDGEGFTTLEIDAITGKHPATVGRSSDPKDKIFQGRIDMSGLTKLFGGEILQDNYLIARMVRSMAGIEPTGNPYDGGKVSTKQDPSATTADEQQRQQQIDSEVQDREEAAVAPNEDFNDAQINAPTPPAASSTPPLDAVIDSGGDKEPKTPDADVPFDVSTSLAKLNAQRMVSNQDVISNKDALLNTVHDPDAPLSSKTAAQLRLFSIDVATGIVNAPDTLLDIADGLDPENKQALREQTRSGTPIVRAGAMGLLAWDDVAKGVKKGVTQAAVRINDDSSGAWEVYSNAVNSTAGFLADVASEVITGKKPETQGQPIDDKLSKVMDNISLPGLSVADKPASNLNHIKEAGLKPERYAPHNFVKPGESIAETLLSTPTAANREVITGMAASLTTGSSKSRTPTMPQMYNAVALTKIGYMTPTQLMNFAKTNTFNGVVGPDWQLFDRGEGGIVAVDRNTLSSASIPGTKTAKKSDPMKDWRDRKELIENSYEFRDFDGKIDDTRVQEFMEKADAASDALGLSSEQRTDPGINFSLKRGQQYVNRFSPDSSQVIDINPFDDPKLYGNNMALGFMADQLGVEGQKNADKFLFDYGITLRTAFRDYTLEELLAAVANAESAVKARHEVQGGDINDIRTDLVAEGIDNYYKEAK